MRSVIAAVALSVMLSGCQTTAQPMVNSFNPAAAAFAKASGSGAIVGQAFARQVGGGVVTAAGSPVVLLPDQPFTREVAMRAASGAFLPNDASPLAGYGRSTTADASGSFRFTDLPDGDYVVMSEVNWGVPTQYGVMNQGGAVYRDVRVITGSTTEVILAR